MNAPTLSGRDHETGVDGECMPGCLACYVRRLETVAGIAAGIVVAVDHSIVSAGDLAGPINRLRDALRALDGEPCPDCVDGIAPKDGNDGGTRYACPTCGGSGWWSDRQRCEGCGGSGWWSDRQRCEGCGGSGLVPSKEFDGSTYCDDCGGSGRLAHMAHDGLGTSSTACETLSCPTCSGSGDVLTMNPEADKETEPCPTCGREAHDAG